MRLGVLGNLSEISSANANSVNTITAGSDVGHTNDGCSFSQPKCAAHGVFAGAVNDRNPPNTTIKNAKMCSAHSGSNLTRKPLFVNPDSILCLLKLPKHPTALPILLLVLAANAPESSRPARADC